jgi:DNA polymerase-3 subunit gamma/tau
MAYEVLARKWRPQQFADVVGQDHVTQTLQNAIKANRIAHAYLFVGPRGTGKTSLARLFAKALNCKTGPTVTPCGLCDSCREITAGTSMDVQEIDGASNNSVDQVRELRDNVKFAPTLGKYKIYIIDEVHMLSTAAFNALLKTLEEPPQHVKFFFATTEAHKVLPTIVSRCQRFDLRRIPVALIIERLNLIAKAEKVSLDSDAALAIARGAEGGLRDAESAMDQLIAFRGETITEADVLSVFGLVSRQTLELLATAILKGDVGEIVRIVAELDAGGKDMQRLVLEMLDHFRSLLVYLCVPQAASTMDVVSAQMESLKQQAQLAQPDRLMRIAEVLSQAEDRMRYSLSRRTLVETSLIRCARATTVSVDELLSRLEALGQAVGGGAVIAPPPAAPARVEAAREAPAAYVARTPAPAAVRPPVPKPASAPVRAAAPTPAPAPANELATLVAQWRDQVVERVKREVPLAGMALLDARPLVVEQNRVVIGFDPEFPRKLEQMKIPTYHAAVHKIMVQILKRPINVEFVLLGEGEAADLPADHTVDRVGTQNPPAGTAPGKGGASQPKSRQDWHQEPVVRKTLEFFNGSIVDIRE